MKKHPGARGHPAASKSRGSPRTGEPYHTSSDIQSPSADPRPSSSVGISHLGARGARCNPGGRRCRVGHRAPRDRRDPPRLGTPASTAVSWGRKEGGGPRSRTPPLDFADEPRVASRHTRALRRPPTTRENGVVRFEFGVMENWYPALVPRRTASTVLNRSHS